MKNISGQIAFFVVAGFALMVWGIRKFYTTQSPEVVDHMAKMREAKANKAKLTRRETEAAIDKIEDIDLEDQIENLIPKTEQDGLQKEAKD